ncbi:MAG: hypothetical protein ACOWWO_04800 [Peptococcaceae bacterium]
MQVYLRKNAINAINEWKSLVSKLELSDENILALLKCLDFGQMYDLARELKIVQGYLFNEIYRPDFIAESHKTISNSAFIKNERKQLQELLVLSAEEYLDNLYSQAAYKLYKKNKAFNEELQQDFYKVMRVVAQLNIAAVKKYATEKTCVIS